MRIGIITFSQALNYGATLQMYALQKYIKELDADSTVEIIDYRSPYLSRFYSLSYQKHRNPIATIIKKAFFLYKKNKFDSFTKKYISFSKTTYTDKNINQIDDLYDVVIVGSDQVWNLNLSYYDYNYFLEFLNKTPKFSYAASIGTNNYSEDAVLRIKMDLSLFAGISVREKTGKEMIDSIFESNVSRVDIDPTLLLSSNDWLSFCQMKKRRKYLLVYTVVFSKEILTEALEFGRKNNLEVLYVGQHCSIKGVKYLVSPSITDLLSLFYNAEYVFVNSFHGTVFSIQFHKQFYSKLELKDGRNSRITNLLEVCQLEERTSLNNIEKEIDWNNVDLLINQNRDESTNYITRIINYGV